MNIICGNHQPLNPRLKQLHANRVITWYPWVGADYQEGGLMVVGESTYADSENGDTPELACRNVNSNVNFIIEGVYKHCIFHSKGNRTFTGVSRVLCDDSMISDNITSIGRAVWRRIAYMDVIQRTMRGLPSKNSLLTNAWRNITRRERPSKELWKPGWKAVLNVVDILKPKALLFVGAGVADHCNRDFLPDGYECSMVRERLRPGLIVRTGELILRNGEAIKICAMPNPGSQRGFNANDWRSVVRKHIPMHNIDTSKDIQVEWPRVEKSNVIDTPKPSSKSLVEADDGQDGLSSEAEFWRAFAEKYRGGKSEFSERCLPSRRYWGFPVGNGVSYYVTFNRNCIKVELYIDSQDAKWNKDVCRKLEECLKPTNPSINFDTLEGKRASRVSFENHTLRFTDRGMWSDALDWLCANLDSFRSITENKILEILDDMD